jgi:UDP-GlcNAc:undecaprenyl-phosphate GlcNAc-1-phosphate transferase
MGDTGALLLGYVLSSISCGNVQILCSCHFCRAVLALAVPLCDTVFAFFRRVLRGQNPMKTDRGHFHHRLIDSGFSQKQAVAILYIVSTVLGLAAVVLATRGRVRLAVLFVAFLVAGVFWYIVNRNHLSHHCRATQPQADDPEPKKEDAHGQN